MRRIAGLIVALMTLVFGANARGIVVVETVTVGNPGNPGDTRYPTGGVSRFGGVGYTCQMGKYDITTGQYCAFLNAVAATDDYGLYSVSMADPTPAGGWGCNIQRSGSPGSYTYTVGDGSPTDVANWANRPVNWVSWGDAARFANWMHNGQPTGTQGLTTTEDGSYFLNGATTNAALLAVTRKANAIWVIPNEDEWYKAVYFDPAKPGGAGYWDYPARTNSTPINVPDPNGINNANFYDNYGTGTGGWSIGGPYYLTNVGAFTGSPGPYGTFDQGGDLFQWNETKAYTWARILRGGSFSYNSDYLHASLRAIDNPTNEYYHIGFRLARPFFKAGDMNCDHAVNTNDIPYFVSALVGGNTGCDVMLADMNGDDSVDGADIQLFINAMLGG